MKTARLFFTMAVFLVAASAPAAMPLHVIPANPDSHDAVRVVTFPSCTSGAPHVTRTERQVRIEFHHMPGYGCIATFAPYARAVDVGVLEGGEWEIVVWDFEQGTSSARVTVRGVDPFAIYPPGTPTTGGRVRLGSEFFFASNKTRVFFGDAEATVRTGGDSRLWVDAPPHAPGIVDVTAVTPEGKTLVARQAFKYYEASATPDPFVFEPLLFPSAYQGPGANGSEWRSENVIAPSRRWQSPVVLHAPPCEGCPTAIEEPIRIESPSRPDGMVLWFARGDRDDWSLSSRLRDLSRSHLTTGTEVPVVRTDDFRSHIALTNVPNDGRHRAMVRVWSIDPRLSQVYVSLRSGNERLPGGGSVRLWPTGTGFAFGSMDLTPSLSGAPSEGIVTLSVSAGEEAGGSIWAMATITNNETQQVTVLTPN